ncbi:MAG: 2,3-oxidosqualene cyclase [Deltaproteobacteria bacterium]|nr:2,3-oxidosqualene cyclase [Nannocystaceae bacterium]
MSGDSDAAVQRAYQRAIDHLSTVQQPKGAFAGEVVWNPMLPCQYVILCHIVGHEIPAARRQRIRRALEDQLRPDGGWGMHPDSPSYLFHTTLGYVALRLLGHPPEDPLCAGARQWIRDHGGVWTIPTWGRIWLAMLGLYPWKGVQPIVPELWLLPETAPLHPRRLYCHMRLIYLGLSFVYGNRFVAPKDQTIAALERELYPEGYDERRCEQFRDVVAPTDLFEEPSPALKRAFSLVRKLERFAPARLRKRALARALEHIKFEFRSTDFVCLSPVNGMLFSLALHITDPRHPDLARALRALEYWFWEDDEQGLRIAGAKSDIWDTSFLLQAMSEHPHAEGLPELARKAARWLPTAQIQEEISGGAEHFREPAYGGWGFADERHPWPVSDCTAAAAEALMRCERAGLSDEAGHLALGRVLAAVVFVLRRQNPDGGFGSYEPRRGAMVLRHYNPSEIYGNCMLEYSYSECTGSCVRALAWISRELGDRLPAELATQVRTSIAKGREFLLAAQHSSGAWLGFWGVDTTYGTFFTVAGLLASGVGRSHLAIARACRWLVDIQRPDGGWGESYLGVVQGHPIPLADDEPSSAAQTAWALLTLMEAAPHEREAIDRGISYLLARQGERGAWPRERATGVFFNTAVLDYELYRQVFPTWALARYLAAGSNPGRG